MKRLHKNDLVIVIAGKDKGRSGRVKSFATFDRIIVEKVNMVKRHRKPAKNFPGGIEEKEAPIHISNVMLTDPKSKERTRLRIKTDGDKPIRISAKSGEAIG
jgi:large subunit ribosomal protein L24